MVLLVGNASDIFGEDIRYKVFDYQHSKLPLVDGVSGRSKRTLEEDDLPIYERACKRHKEEIEKDLQDYEDKKAHEAELVKRNAELEKHEGTEETKWKVFRISQRNNNGYDTYDSAIVVAESEGDARMIHPGGWSNADTTSEVDRMEGWVGHAEGHYKKLGPMPGWYSPENTDWVRPAFVEVEFISSYDGDPKYHNYTLTSSFNAG
jgi:hypothetical protein